MEYIFWGHNIPLAAHLRETLQCKIIECITFQQIKSCLSSIEYIDFCVFMERSDMATDIPTIAQLHKLYPTLYIILISETLSKEEKIPYLRAGTDCMIIFDRIQTSFMEANIRYPGFGVRYSLLIPDTYPDSISYSYRK